MADYILSVDGGGTKTEFCISDMEGHIKDSVIVGCSNYKSVGVEAVRESFQAGFELLEKKGIRRGDLRYSVWGISGCDSEHDFSLIRAVLEGLGIDGKTSYLCNDGILAFYAQAMEPGMVVIAGTGSIILGIGSDGEYKRASGWGYNISDIGSGYWIGAEALKHTLLYCDGCGGYSPFFDCIREYFKADSFERLPYVVTEVTDYYEIARLAELVTEEAGRGEEVTLGILRHGAEVIARLMGSIYRRMGFDSRMELNIVFSGGVLKSRIYQQLIKEELARQIPLEHVTFSIQKHAPVYGGIRLARRILGQGLQGQGGLSGEDWHE
ncbi:N-acetylglucosamine kinase [Enterocloster sp. OA13]|uniref:BadF/BadG/BcrA/BcrD ATPase family protein n=1 Tax=Enterocloster hominis (ex Hitch et al. 2024) TaxID=1917870 RepID=A0ABV1D4L0_9FIRM|nr:BadF/BadG/BcrA/BcrD ATPase family protein [Clostridiales bacterium 1_7_47FAA]MCH1950328.1 N-acetylglucosamine kinase [Enterocloster sp. OA13]